MHQNAWKRVLVGINHENSSWYNRSVTTAFLKSRLYAYRGLLVVADPESIKWSGEPDVAFSGWRRVPVHRPLPVLAGIQSRPVSAIVERRASVTLDELFPSFRQRAGVVMNCKPGDWENFFEWDYGPGDVCIRDAARLSDGRQLVGLRLDFKKYHCDGIPDEIWSTFWFLIEETGHVDGKGDIEAIFFWSGYNEDGYVLFHDGFRKQEVFSWSYH